MSAIVPTMAISRKQASADHLPRATPPIKYLTENGFSIVRLSEINYSVMDTPEDCRFLVQHEDKAEREIRVGFDEKVIASLLVRRRIPLSDTSKFWLVCAESCLATYLWEKNEYPPEGRLTIDELPPDELMLALHWRDSE
jgi:hypothetical protein